MKGIKSLILSSQFVAVLALLMCGVGCNNMNMPWSGNSSSTVHSMQHVHEELAKASVQLNRTNALLDQLGQGNDLQANFKNYTDAVHDLQKAADGAKARGAQMREKRDAYLAAWQKEAETIQNPEVKEGVEARQQRIRDNFSHITELADQARDAYGPYLQDLRDVEAALKKDLTPAGVKAIAPGIAKAKADGEILAKRLDALGVEVNKVQGRITPAPKT